MMPVLTEKPVKTPVTTSNFKVPDKWTQVRTFVSRNLKRKIADRQYMVINLLEAPLLAFILGYISNTAKTKFTSFQAT